MTTTSKCKESAYWKHKEREEFGDLDHEFLHHHALYIGYIVTNALVGKVAASPKPLLCLFTFEFYCLLNLVFID